MAAIAFVNESLAYAERIAQEQDDAFKAAHVRQRLYYHNGSHTRDIRNRTLRFCTALRLHEEDTAAALAAAGKHDARQSTRLEWRSVGGQHVRMRTREPGIDEIRCATEVVSDLNAFSYPVNPRSMLIAWTGIVATIPEWDEAHATVRQPYNAPHLYLAARCVGWADINGCGMDPEGFLREGALLFWELYPDIAASMLSPHAKKPSPSTETAAHHVVLTHLLSQLVFAEGRRDLFPSELEGLTRKQRSAVLAHCKRYDESIALAKARIDKATQLKFSELMRLLHPGVCPWAK